MNVIELFCSAVARDRSRRWRLAHTHPSIHQLCRVSSGQTHLPTAAGKWFLLGAHDHGGSTPKTHSRSSGNFPSQVASQLHFTSHSWFTAFIQMSLGHTMSWGALMLHKFFFFFNYLKIIVSFIIHLLADFLFLFFVLFFFYYFREFIFSWAGKYVSVSFDLSFIPHIDQKISK